MKPNLIKDYVETGKVRFEFRDYAFRGPDALLAAQAAACANDQGAFWSFHDTLFANQRAPEGFSNARLKQIAESLKLDMPAFNSCLDSGAKKAEVEKEISEGQAQGVDSTPTLFVNGVEAPWSPWEELKKTIDAALAEGS
ncbi:MAG: DsbA family protein [Thermomicrobiales bacterium]